MADTSILEKESPSDLQTRWQALKGTEPGLRAKEAAARLGVTEAELVACRCGEGVRRLSGPWGDLLQDLPSLGEVMALTRNEHVVHEKHGTYGNISVARSMGLVLNREIDLREQLGQRFRGCRGSRQRPPAQPSVLRNGRRGDS